jgi:hypothetical protein
MALSDDLFGSLIKAKGKPRVEINKELKEQVLRQRAEERKAFDRRKKQKGRKRVRTSKGLADTIKRVPKKTFTSLQKRFRIIR